MVPSVGAVEVGVGVAINIVMAADVASPVAVEVVAEGVGLDVEVPISGEETATDEAMDVLVEDASTVVVAATVPSEV